MDVQAEQKEKEVALPKLGESIHQAVVVQWLKKEGELVTKDEPVVEVLTDKVASEIPSPISGWLIKQCKQANEECQVGEVLFIIAPKEAENQEVQPPPFFTFSITHRARTWNFYARAQIHQRYGRAWAYHKKRRIIALRSNGFFFRKGSF